jgi:hypothetical protein
MQILAPHIFPPVGLLRIAEPLKRIHPFERFGKQRFFDKG